MHAKKVNQIKRQLERRGYKVLKALNLCQEKEKDGIQRKES